MAVIITVTEWFQNRGDQEGESPGDTITQINVGDTFTVIAIDQNNNTVTLSK